MNTHPMRSVFFKLMAAYLVAFLVIAGGAALVRIFSSSSRNMDISADNLRHYAVLLTEKIGTPPSLETAQAISGETGISIRISGRNMRWSSTGDLIDDEETLLHDDDIFSLIPGEEEPYIEIERAGFHYYFSEFHADRPMSFTIWLIMSASVLLALIISYLMVHHQLRPLREMHETALEFGISDWKKRVVPRGSDELATLARAMNAMADRIEEYIHSMHDLLIAVSHELRSPLTRMKVALEFIGDSKVKNSLNEEIGILDRMTGTLLEQRKLTSGRGGLNLEEVDLHSWVNDACSPYLGKDTILSVIYSGSERKALIDKGRMDLAVRNLIENSLRHASGSKIHVTLICQEEKGFVLGVADEGPGIPEDLLGRIGEPFLLGDASRTGRRSGGGFGLGLSIVKAVASAHGAEFRAVNLNPQGLQIELVFP